MNRPVQLGSFKISTVLLLLNIHIKVVKMVLLFDTVRTSNRFRVRGEIQCPHSTVLKVKKKQRSTDLFFLCRLLINKNKTLKQYPFCVARTFFSFLFLPWY